LLRWPVAVSLPAWLAAVLSGLIAGNGEPRLRRFPYRLFNMGRAGMIGGLVTGRDARQVSAGLHIER
jgi:hypothetical protein